MNTATLKTAPTQQRRARLIMVSDANNNKFYNMNALPDGTFSVEYGRVGSRAATATYDLTLWEKKYREKNPKRIYRRELFVCR